MSTWKASGFFLNIDFYMKTFQDLKQKGTYTVLLPPVLKEIHVTLPVF